MGLVTSFTDLKRRWKSPEFRYSKFRFSTCEENEPIKRIDFISSFQLQLLEAISALPQTEQTSDSISKLNSGLLDISQLYSDFAEPYGGDSQNFLLKFIRFFVTLGLKILKLFRLKVVFEADIIEG